LRPPETPLRSVKEVGIPTSFVDGLAARLADQLELAAKLDLDSLPLVAALAA
jgi:hypothetical protein